MAEDNNGYLDPNQSVIDWAVRELGYSFSDFSDPSEDPVYLLSRWKKLYKRSFGASVFGAIAGAATLCIGITIGANPLAAAGLAAVGIAGLGAKHHKAGQETCDDEIRVLEENPKLIDLLMFAEQQGLPKSQLVSLYNGFLKRAIANPTWAGNHDSVEQYFLEAMRKIDSMQQLSGAFSRGKVDFMGVQQSSYDRFHSPEAQQSLPPAKESSPLSLGSSLLKKASTPAPVMSAPTAIPEMDLTVREYVDSTPPAREIPTETNILSLPLDKRAIVVVNRMKDNGFQIDQILSKSVVAIAGEQRGGKGTLLAMLAILMKASNPNMQIHYYTAGSDLYPVGFDRVICAKSFPSSANPDTHVFEALYEQVKGLEKFESYEAKNTFIVIDEAIALGAAANPEKNQWLAKFLLTRFSKTGARAAIVLHASNLSSWLGIGNTGGMAQTFKNGASFIGCGTQGMPDPHNPLCSIQIASGEYFLVDPDNFGKSLKNGDLGRVPEWLLTTKNPHNGSPDPVRSLLQFFPELVNSNPVTIAASTHKPKDDWSNYMPDEEVHHGDVQEVNDPWFVEPQSPKIAKLIEDLQRSKDDRASSFISFLSGLQVGEEISAKGIDPQFIQIAVARKILKRNGSRLEVVA